MGILVEAYKITKTVDVRVVTEGHVIPRIVFQDKHVLSEDEKRTQEYDALAFRLVSYVLGVRACCSTTLTPAAVASRVRRILAALQHASVLVLVRHLDAYVLRLRRGLRDPDPATDHQLQAEERRAHPA